MSAHDVQQVRRTRLSACAYAFWALVRGKQPCNIHTTVLSDVRLCRHANIRSGDERSKCALEMVYQSGQCHRRAQADAILSKLPNSPKFCLANCPVNFTSQVFDPPCEL